MLKRKSLLLGAMAAGALFAGSAQAADETRPSSSTLKGSAAWPDLVQLRPRPPILPPLTERVDVAGITIKIKIIIT